MLHLSFENQPRSGVEDFEENTVVRLCKIETG